MNDKTSDECQVPSGATKPELPPGHPQCRWITDADIRRVASKLIAEHKMEVFHKLAKCLSGCTGNTRVMVVEVGRAQQ